MQKPIVLSRFVAGLILLSGLSVSHPVFSQTFASFSFSYSEELTGGPLSGRLLLLVNQDTATDPDLPDPFHPFITFGRDFSNWGTTHTAVTQGTFQQKRYGMTGIGEEKIIVFLNQDCRFGFHVFADSKNNGPRTTSFVTDFLPAFEAQYRAVPHREARFLTGQSSGAWAALWLMIQYPDTFGMAWAASPDPVDFSRFLNIDLYSPDASLYYDRAGSLRNGIDSDTIYFSLRDWIQMEKALGDGGQFQSFEAVFGGKAANGLPDQLFGRETGEIIPSTLKSWEAYDINRGEALKEQLDGRITIVVADDDPFFLDEPVKTLKNTMDLLGIEADIRILEKGGHNTWTDSIR